MSQKLYALLREAENASTQRRALIQNQIAEMALRNKPGAHKDLAECVAEVFVGISMGKRDQLTANYPAIAILAGLPVDWSLVK